MAEEPVGAPLSLHDPRRVGPWEIHARLGAGGMGVVYLGTSGNQTAAVKVIRPGLLDAPATRERFGREVAILRSVRDVHISQFLAADLRTEPAWLAIEYISGPVLRDEVADHGPLAEDEWWELARGLSQALAVLEVHRVTHRDIKPGNVILNERGPVLIDFGIAHPEDATSLTATGLVTGSPAWLSPEQANLEPTGPASDVFCLGSLLAFAATGRPPFGEGASVAVLVSIATRDPDLKGVDPTRAALLSRMLAKEPGRRPTARDVLAVTRLARDHGTSEIVGLAGTVPAAPEPARPTTASPPTPVPAPTPEDLPAETVHLAPPPVAAADSGDDTAAASPLPPAGRGEDGSTRVAGGEATVVTPLPRGAARPVPPPTPPASDGGTLPGAPLPDVAPATAVPRNSGGAPAGPNLMPPPRPRTSASRVARQPARRGRSAAPAVLGLLALVALVAVVWLLLRDTGATDGSQGNPSSTPTSTGTSQAPPAPSSDQLRDGQWLLESYRLVNSGSALSVSGTIRNTGTATASGRMTVWVYQGGESLGSVSTTVADVPGGGAADVTMTGDAVFRTGAKVVLLQAS